MVKQEGTLYLKTPYNALKSFSDREDLSHTSHYSKSYHNSLSSVNCPRCGKSGELAEDGIVRALYRCRSCGMFAKVKPKRLHGLRQLIACQELTTALEILEVAGHKDQDAIDALNLYRGVVSHA
ncbi:MAG: hypothetical protein IM504_10585 [Microcystis sp. M038S2]|uniref:hypothetical protein n=1 Tax=unclassified Microcystis TaxID=2643300 RepID=UPI00118F18EA|nr:MULTISPECIES: hypothetical protein [unclassified Microcystis]TRU57767.1 MAG: hypothetical protein EWV56_15895 [Microcystis aeruginosa Ma_QC_C_20070823_S13D]TRU60769.1 MAG: hypothetical protein EWV48_12345 [Microcystis aeruginosa Ma_QC_C_20070823_S13]MCA2683627.1 hypothetical protein [Microcystis sp. M046S2]MCA2705293.1 hypothetical protein [Microcystis sp. M038S2]MCA2946960.1 hypothetical protein [Microcystis sp. M109S1]